MSVRITRPVRRVLDQLSEQPGTASEVANRAGLNFTRTLDLLDRLASEGMVEVGEFRQYHLTPQGRSAREADETARNAPSDPLRDETGARPRAPRPRPPYTDRRTPWPRGEGRPR